MIAVGALIVAAVALLGSTRLRLELAGRLAPFCAGGVV